MVSISKLAQAYDDIEDPEHGISFGSGLGLDLDPESPTLTGADRIVINVDSPPASSAARGISDGPSDSDRQHDGGLTLSTPTSKTGLLYGVEAGSSLPVGGSPPLRFPPSIFDADLKITPLTQPLAAGNDTAEDGDDMSSSLMNDISLDSSLIMVRADGTSSFVEELVFFSSRTDSQQSKHSVRGSRGRGD